MIVNALMIDDHPPIIEGYKAMLSYNPFGYEVNSKTGYSLETAYKILTDTLKPSFDIIFIDITLTPFEEQNLYSGEDLIPVIRKYCPEAKIVVLTSHSESLVLYKIVKEYKPEGILIKSDFMPNEFINAFHQIMTGKNYYSATIEKLNKLWDEKEKVLDGYNSQILLLLSQGVQTKNMPEILHLSQSAIDKRKAILKTILGLEKANDEDILKEARKQGLI